MNAHPLRRCAKGAGRDAARGDATAAIEAGTVRAEPKVRMSHLLRRIVVPVDFSETSDHALRVAAGYATESGAEISLVHVIQNSERAMGMELLFWTEDRLNAAKESARKVVEGRASVLRDAHINYGTTLLSGNPEEEIVRYATVEHADLIVMGTHGRTGIARIAMGSVAQRVVAHAPCPVLMVRKPVESREPQT